MTNDFARAHVAESQMRGLKDEAARWKDVADRERRACVAAEKGLRRCQRKLAKALEEIERLKGEN